MTEEQAYDVLAAYPDVELRRYPEHLVAEIEVGGRFELAGHVAFPWLARYLGGHNRSSGKMAMGQPGVGLPRTGPRDRRWSARWLRAAIHEPQVLISLGPKAPESRLDG